MPRIPRSVGRKARQRSGVGFAGPPERFQCAEDTAFCRALCPTAQWSGVRGTAGALSVCRGYRVLSGVKPDPPSMTWG